MATKDDVRAIVRDELAPIRSELKSIRDDLAEKFKNVIGFRYSARAIARWTPTRVPWLDDADELSQALQYAEDHPENYPGEQTRPGNCG
jgi:hypothetical protein